MFNVYVLVVNLSVILFYCELTIIKPNNNVGIEKILRAK
jgi:hypothetical protein